MLTIEDMMGVVLGKLIVPLQVIHIDPHLLTGCQLLPVWLGSEEPFDRMRPALMTYVKEDLLHGNPDTRENRQVRLGLYSQTGA